MTDSGPLSYVVDMGRNDPPRSDREPHLAYVTRLIQWDAWWKAHDEFCDYGDSCCEHKNPYDSQ